MTRKLQKDYLWNSLGVLLQNAVSPILLVIVARINGVYDAGLFSLAFSLAIIFWAIAMWGGRTYQVSDATSQFSTQSYLTTRLLLGVAVLIGAVLFCFVSGYSADKTTLVVVLVAMKVVESIADMLHGVLQRNDKLHVVGKILALKAFTGVAVFALVDIVTRNILLASVSLAITTLAVTILVDWPRATRLDKEVARALQSARLSVPAALKIVRVCSPVFGMTFLAMLSLNIPRYFLDMYHEEELGFFGIIAMPITLIVMIVSFVLQPQVVQLSRYVTKGQGREFNKIIHNIIAITLSIGLIMLAGTALIGVQVLSVIFDVNFENYYTALIVIVIGAIFNAGVGIYLNIFVIMRRFRSQFYILLITNVMLCAASIYIVYMWGLLAAVWLFTITNVIQVVLLSIAYARAQKGVFVEEN